MRQKNGSSFVRMMHATKLATKIVPMNLMHVVQKAIFQGSPATHEPTLLTMFVIQFLFLTNTSLHIAQ